METLDYTIILSPEPEGGFTVAVPALPGCITYGRTLDEAKHMAADAIRGYLVSLSKHGEKIPNDAGNFIASVKLRRVGRASRVHA